MSAAFDHDEAFFVSRVYSMETQELKLAPLPEYVEWIPKNGPEAVAIAKDGVALYWRAVALYHTLPGVEQDPTVMQFGLGDIGKIMQLIEAFRQLAELYKKFQPQG